MRYLFIGLVVLSLSGCVTLGEVVREGSQITGEEIAPATEGISVILNDFVPAPYKIPAAIAIGYVIALLRRIYKKKKGSTDV